LIYAQVEKAGIVMAVRKDEYEDLVKSLSREELVKFVMHLSDQIAELKRVQPPSRSGSGLAS